LQHRGRLLKVNDVDAVTGGEDVFLHLWVPPSGLVTEMGACFQELFNCSRC
jgi:hypothetical protein